jgi:thiamine-phosphate pyrophosphorylase
VRPVPPRLYVITDRRATNGRPVADVVRAALTGVPAEARGAVAVQLREKDLDERALLALARELRAVTRDAGAPLWINGAVEVALAVGADGLHLGVAGPRPDEVARLDPELPLAISTHTRAEVEAARSAPNVVFAVFGPIWETPSKRAYGPPVGLEALREAVSVGPPLVALGGVTPARAAACRQAGAVGVACVRVISEAPDPAAVVREFLSVPESVSQNAMKRT